MVQYGFYYDNSRCTGCKTCVMACKDYKDSALDVAYRKVYDLEGGTWEKQADDIYTCLLYTSPSPRDRSLSRMPSSA